MVKKFGELKSICIGNVIEIVKIGKNLVNCCNSPNSPKFFYCQSFLLYGSTLITITLYPIGRLARSKYYYTIVRIVKATSNYIYYLVS